MSIDVIRQVGAVCREVTERKHEGKSRRVVALRRTYATSADDVWDALTRPERLARWFETVTGDFRLGGRFQIEKASVKGQVTACRPPRQLTVTWEAWGDTSWVDVQLSPAPDGGTVLELEHILSRRLFDRLYWSWFGAGATGVGWELWLLGLDVHLAGAVVDLDSLPASPEGKDFVKRSSDAWCSAEIAMGERSAKANKRAARAFAFYTRRAAH